MPGGRKPLVVGQEYGGLRVIEANYDRRVGKNWGALVECLACGSHVWRDASNVRSCSMKSCGCLKIKNAEAKIEREPEAS